MSGVSLKIVTILDLSINFGRIIKKSEYENYRKSSLFLYLHTHGDSDDSYESEIGIFDMALKALGYSNVSENTALKLGSS